MKISEEKIGDLNYFSVFNQQQLQAPKTLKFTIYSTITVLGVFIVSFNLGVVVGILDRDQDLGS